MKLNLYSLILLVILNLISLVLFFHLGIKGIQKMYDAIDYINKDTIQEYNKSKDSLQQGNGIIPYRVLPAHRCFVVLAVIATKC